MNLNADRICRGCIREVTGDPVSLLRPNIRKLYEKCTYQSLPDTGPQLICRECLKECQNWLLFKTICRENEKLYSPEAPELEPSDSVDGGMPMVLKVEEEDDLLDLWVKGIKYARVCHNDKGGLDSETVPGHSIDKTTQTKDNLQEDNPMDTSMPRPPIPISPESIELRLSMLMGIPIGTVPEEENNHHEALNESLTDILNHSVENNDNVLASSVDSHQNIFNNAIKIQDSVSGPCYNLGQEETEERIVLPHTKNVFPTNEANGGKIMKRISIGKEFPCEEFKHQGITLKDVNRFKDYLELVEELIPQDRTLKRKANKEDRPKKLMKYHHQEDFWMCPRCIAVLLFGELESQEPIEPISFYASN